MPGSALNSDQITALFVLALLILVFAVPFWRRRETVRYNLRQDLMGR